MVFKRKKRPSLQKRIRDFFWPPMGWKRSFSYIRHRAIRLQASNYAVAAGLSFGCAISFAPTLGFHIIQCLLLCFIFRANYLAGMLGTLFGNPWTFPFLFLISYKVGWFILNMTGLETPFSETDLVLTWKTIKESPMSLFMPMLMGGYIMVLVTFPVFYGVFYAMVRSARLARQRLIEAQKK